MRLIIRATGYIRSPVRIISYHGWCREQEAPSCVNRAGAVFVYQSPREPMAKRKNKDLSFSPQCFTLKLEVFPQAAMAKEKALKLATNLAMHQELTDIHMGDEAWVFRRPQAKGHSRGHVEVKVEDQEITIEHQFPNAGLER